MGRADEGLHLPHHRAASRGRAPLRRRGRRPLPARSWLGRGADALAVTLALGLSALSPALSTAGCATSPVGEGSSARLLLRYAVTYAPAPGASTLQVRILVPPAAPRRWLLSDAPRVPLAVTIRRLDGPVREVTLDSAAPLLLPGGSLELEYAYPLDRVSARRSGLKAGAGEAGAHCVAGDAYLLRPREVPPGTEVALSVASPVPALLPWPAPERGQVYRLPRQALYQPGFHTFGGTRETLEVGGGRIELALLPGETRVGAAGLQEWIERAARELLTVVERLPYRRLTVTVVPRAGARSPSPFGMLLWSDPPSVALYAGAEATPEAFARDWVAVHELLHSLHPFFVPRTAWLSEGLATHYQTVVRTRSGRLPELAAWRKVVEGVAAGAREAGELTLGELSRRMHELHRYRAVYWGGAIAALDLDLELRQATGGARSLDDVLAHLAATPGRRADVAAFEAAVDAVAGRPLAGEVLRRHREGPALAGAFALLERLGVRGRRPAAVRLDDAAPWADLRRALTGAK